MLTVVFLCLFCSEHELKKLARLLVCNFRALESEYEVDALLQTLKEVPMIPLANGSVVSLISEGVFFPLSDVTQANTGKIFKYIISTSWFTSCYRSKDWVQ